MFSRALEHGGGLLLGALANGLKCAVDDALGDGLLARRRRTRLEASWVTTLEQDRVIDGAAGSGPHTGVLLLASFAP